MSDALSDWVRWQSLVVGDTVLHQGQKFYVHDLYSSWGREPARLVNGWPVDDDGQSIGRRCSVPISEIELPS